MVSGMATRKITITLQEQQIDEVRALVAAGAAANVSAFAQHAIGVALSDALAAAPAATRVRTSSICCS